LKRVLRTPILCSLLAVTCFAAETNKTVYELSDGVVRPSRWKGAEEAYLPMIVNSSHAATLVELPNRDILCFWYAGIYERGSGESIVMSRLDHGSKRWTGPQVVSYNPGWANQNPVAFLAPDGRVWLFHTTQEAGHDQTKDLVFALVSDDQGHTWSKPTTLFPNPGLYLRQPPIVFHRDWLFPVYHSAGGSITSNAQKDHSYVEVSRDQGKTWTECDVPDSGGEVQMSIVKSSDDSLIAFFRSRFADWIYRSESTDGCHWTSPHPTSLPNNNASIQATRLQNGHLVIVFNNAQATRERGKAQTAARRILSVALSTDDGRTWPWIRDLEDKQSPPAILPLEDPEYSYPAIMQSKDGMIRTAYTFRRETIKYMTFDEEWIKHGTTQGGDPDDIKPEGVASLEPDRKTLV
jgi:predicted neuraminidase